MTQILGASAKLRTVTINCVMSAWPTIRMEQLGYRCTNLR